MIRVPLFGPHMKQYRLLVLKASPLGTLGVCVVTVTDTAFSRSNASRCSVMMHLVDFGPMDEFSGLMYDRVRDLFCSVRPFLSSSICSSVTLISSTSHRPMKPPDRPPKTIA